MLSYIMVAAGFWLCGYYTGRSTNRGRVATLAEIPPGECTTTSLQIHRDGIGYLAIIEHANGSFYGVRDHHGLPGKWRRRFCIWQKRYYPQPLPSSD